MNETYVSTTPWWLRALQLDERLNIIGEPAERRDSAAYASADDESVARRLRQTGCTEATAAWMNHNAYERARSCQRPELTSGDTPFLTLLRPLITRAVATLHGLLSDEPAVNGIAVTNVDTLIAILLPALKRRLATIVTPTLVLELNVARLQGVLVGADAQARFVDYIARLADPSVARALREEYPVIMRQAMTTVDQWVAASAEFAWRFARDWPALRAQLFLSNTDELQSVQVGAGDMHRDGRSVMIVTFTSGARVVYKPRSPALDHAFNTLLQWLNAHGAQPDLQGHAVINRGEYGWSEFVAAAPCATQTDVRKFYERQGAFVALLYACNASDFHLENIIAAGAYPILVDLEALMRPVVDAPGDSVHDAGRDAPLQRSVLAVGLLPQRAFAGPHSAGVDISGLGGGAQLSPQPLPHVIAGGTDEMRIGREHLMMAGSQNRPALHGAIIDPADYAADVLSGFDRMYALLVRERHALLAPEGPLAAFADARTRVILRDTQTYAVVLRDALHPDMARDALDRERLFDRLAPPAATGATSASTDPRIFQAECRDLHRGDVPVFSALVNGRAIFGSDGRVVATARQSGFDAVRERFAQLGDADCRRQRWYVEASLATLTTSSAARLGARPPATGSVGKDECLAAACAIGDTLEAQALYDAGRATWLGLRPVGDGYWSLAHIDEHLYDGLAGIALFLAFLGDRTGDARYTHLAQATVASLTSSGNAQVERIGAFSGVGGTISTFATLAALWNRPELAADAIASIERLETAIPFDREFDVLAGSAGAILGLLALDAVVPASRALAVAVRCGEHLAAHAVRTPAGAGWIAWSSGEHPLAGFSHGAAGIARALFALARRTGDPQFFTLAKEAVDYERTLFDPVARNWRDLRAESIDDGGPGMSAWCHGAAGIALARLASLATFDTAAVRDEIAVGLATTRGQGPMPSHGLCHGSVGNLEALLVAADVLADECYESALSKASPAIVGDILMNGPLCSNPSGIATPGFMTGLAGIGYGCLRLAARESVPSILSLDMPKTALPAVRR